MSESGRAWENEVLYGSWSSFYSGDRARTRWVSWLREALYLQLAWHHWKATSKRPCPGLPSQVFTTCLASCELWTNSARLQTACGISTTMKPCPRVQCAVRRWNERHWASFTLCLPPPCKWPDSLRHDVASWAAPASTTPQPSHDQSFDVTSILSTFEPQILPWTLIESRLTWDRLRTSTHGSHTPVAAHARRRDRLSQTYQWRYPSLRNTLSHLGRRRGHIRGYGSWRGHKQDYEQGWVEEDIVLREAGYSR